MENARESDTLARSLIILISSCSDSQTLLTQIAQHLGHYFRVDACLLVAGVSSQETAQILGFWHKDALSWQVTPLSSYPFVKSILAASQPIEHDGSEFGQLDRFPHNASLGMRTEFQGTVNGFILLGTLKARQWTEIEKKVLLESKELIAIACTIAQLQKEASQSDGKETNPNLSFPNLLRGASAQGSPLMKRLYELMRQQLEQQRQLNEMKDDIIDAISDKARNPLSSMKLAIDALSNPERQLPPQSQMTFWRILRQEWGNLNDLITNIVTLKKLESQELAFNPQSIDLVWFLEDIGQLFRDRWAEDRRKQLNLVISPNLDSSWQLYTDPIHLRAILQELLTNAGNFSTPNTTVYLDVNRKDEPENEQIAIGVINTGLGIAPDEKLSIFEPFRRGMGIIEKAIPGTGIGLALVKGLVGLLGGRIEVTSEPIQDGEDYLTSFTLTVPQTSPARKS